MLSKLKFELSGKFELLSVKPELNQ